jgi:hypothetical protein
MRFLAMLLVCAVPVISPGNQNLASKVIRVPLNQNEPAVVKVGTRGITTLEFPYKIEALDGYGFSVSPTSDGADLFQISLNKGTNFLSLKAMREGVEGNLTVVLDGKVYCLFCTAVADPSFVMVFESGSSKTGPSAREILANNKPVSPARLLGFLDKVKGYPSLKVSAPDIFRNMEVAEPNSESSVEGLKVTLRRVIRDDSLDCLGFDFELANQSTKDFLYDPESLGVRIGDEVYPEAVSDAGGIVEAGKTLPAFFVVTGSATGDRNDLAVANKFYIVMRPIVEKRDSKGPTNRKEPAETVPTAQQGSQEPELRVAENNNRPLVAQSIQADDKKPRKAHGRRRKASAPPGEEYAPEPIKRERSDKTAAQGDE